MTEFQEADARLGGMHGYAAVSYCATSGQEGHLCEHLARLEAKVDALMTALRAGAIGKWTP